jgi:signal transduction histidine kinase
MSFRPVPLSKLIDKVVRSIQAKSNSDRKFHVVIPATLPDVWADADRLEQVLLNLVDNAVKYSKPGTEVRITAEQMPPDPTHDNQIRIRISDQGVGIPAEMLPQLFSKFYRIDNHLTRDVEGTGLGLYITKSLTTAMGGHIEVESEPDIGTTFSLIFPAATPERQAIHRRRLYAEDSE